MKKTTILITCSLLITFSLLSCGSSDSSSENTDIKSTAKATEPSGPTFTVYDPNGRLHRYEDYLGQPLMLNFWGTWCGPCRRELPDIKRIYGEYKPKGLEIIGLAVNDHPQKVKIFAEQMGMDWVMLIADINAIKSFNAGVGVPITIFIDRNGNETSRAIGVRSYDYFKAEIEKII
jgi:thiol-disulfide isomerase/thioredoxin